jgi:hypothetical protein
VVVVAGEQPLASAFEPAVHLELRAPGAGPMSTGSVADAGDVTDAASHQATRRAVSLRHAPRRPRASPLQHAAVLRGQVAALSDAIRGLAPEHCQHVVDAAGLVEEVAARRVGLAFVRSLITSAVSPGLK